MSDLINMIQLSLPCVLLILGVRIINSSGMRQAGDVLRDLTDSAGSETRPTKKLQLQQDKVRNPSGLSIEILAGAILGAACNFVALQPRISHLVISLIAGISLGILYRGVRLRASRERNEQSLDYFLPIVMERVVMAVESGLDIVPAIDAVVTLEKLAGNKMDPVTQLLGRIGRYTDSGLGFSQALELLEKEVSAPAFKHALVHLGMAYREGGEIINPLRELSDATQLYFQESVEEIIARIPVKATVPLLCTFAGLIISFLTAPVIQVFLITSRAMPK